MKEEEEEEIIFTTIKPEIEGFLRYYINYRDILEINLRKKVYNPKDA